MLVADACDLDPCLYAALPECYATSAEDKFGRICLPLKITADLFTRVMQDMH